MNIRWAGPALDDLQSIREYLATKNDRAAVRVVGGVVSAVERLEATPWIGRPGRQSGCRELALEGAPFIVAYRVRDETVEVLRVLHTSRRWPRRL